MTPSPRAPRSEALDALRGLVMVLMTLDHARDFFADGFRHDPTDLGHTTPALFVTRWVTHLCAPVFVFLAGLSAALYGRARSAPEVSRFLVTRGLWLVLLELTVLRLGWTPEPRWRFTLLQVIWALGWSMVALAALSRLPRWALASVGGALVLLHNLTDGVRVLGSWRWLWAILHRPELLEPVAGHRFYVAYPLVPWIGVMALGFAFEPLWREPAGRPSRLARLGAALVALFVLLRATNLYGDPSPWSAQPTALFTVFSFVNCTKYPPSLLYLCMTLGPALLGLAALERWEGGAWRRPLVVLGRAPLFYYILHLILLRWTAGPLALLRYGMDGIGPPPRGHLGSPGYPLWGAYVAWAFAVAVLYEPTRRFAEFKARRPGSLWTYL
ncbi:MAG: DUF1624 domain-containing protein [Deltaproteobacteria bacterium]|nr:DUF1624 domain-containing protein [Deltaproteobacteria bacterium]